MIEKFKKIEIDGFFHCVNKILNALRKSIAVTDNDLDTAEKILNPDFPGLLFIPEPGMELVKQHNFALWDLKIAQITSVLSVDKSQAETIAAYLRLKFIRNCVQEITKNFEWFEDDVTPSACIYTTEKGFPEDWNGEFDAEYNDPPFVRKSSYYCHKIYVKVIHTYDDGETEEFCYGIFPTSYCFLYGILHKENGKFVDPFDGQEVEI